MSLSSPVLRRIGFGVVAIVAALAAAEFWLRANIGDRNLYVVHPTIEYMNAPNQSVRYRHKLIETNAQGMRSAPFETQKPDGVFRILVIGDSVIFGHMFTDQADLATTHLSTRRLRGMRIEALNISANSWGPGNELAWIDAFGMFEADAAILETSTDDLVDDRDFTPIHEMNRPTYRPMLQILDPLRRFAKPAPVRPEPPGVIKGDARASLPKLLDRLATLPGGACLIAHETREDRKSLSLTAGAQELLATADSHYAKAVADRDFLDPAKDYVDNIHPSPSGQANLLKAMLDCPVLAGAE